MSDDMAAEKKPRGRPMKKGYPPRLDATPEEIARTCTETGDAPNVTPRPRLNVMGSAKIHYNSLGKLPRPIIHHRWRSLMADQ